MKEQIGVILADNTIVELDNLHSEPETDATLASEDLFTYFYSGEYDVKATWHTHVDESADLSGQDYSTFLLHPDLDHYIIGTDGVKKYVVKEGAVING